MRDEQRIKGRWYLPSAPGTRVPGILTWSQVEGVKLELIGGFPAEAKHDGNGRSVKADTGDLSAPSGTIYGETVAGKPITLWEAELGNYRTNGGDQPLEQFWRAPWLCVGAHLPSAEAPSLRSLKAALDDLYYLTGDGRFYSPQWARIEGVDSPGQQQEDGTLLMPYILPVVGGFRAGVAHGSLDDAGYLVDTFATKPPTTPASEAMPDLKLDLMTRRTRGGQRIELAVEAQARIIPNGAAFAADEIPARLAPLLELVRLATYSSSAVTWMSAETEDDHEVSLLCHLDQNSDPDSSTASNRMVFTLEDIPLQKFLDDRQRLRPNEQACYAWSVAVGLIGHSPGLVEEHVSQVLAAAEGFHRWCLSGPRNTKLETRLVNLHSRLPMSVRHRLGLDEKKWADWAVWARNHVDHGGAEQHRDVGDFYYLRVISDCVRLVTYLVLLGELGVSDDNINEALLNHPRISVLRKSCTELGELPGSR